MFQMLLENLITFPNLVFDLKSINHILRYPNFSAATPAKTRFYEKSKNSKNKNMKFFQHFLAENDVK
jgi:hypothetical protein